MHQKTGGQGRKSRPGRRWPEQIEARLQFLLAKGDGDWQSSPSNYGLSQRESSTFFYYSSQVPASVPPPEAQPRLPSWDSHTTWPWVWGFWGTSGKEAPSLSLPTSSGVKPQPGSKPSLHAHGPTVTSFPVLGTTLPHTTSYCSMAMCLFRVRGLGLHPYLVSNATGEEKKPE